MLPTNQTNGPGASSFSDLPKRSTTAPPKLGEVLDKTDLFGHNVSKRSAVLKLARQLPSVHIGACTGGNLNTNSVPCC